MRLVIVRTYTAELTGPAVVTDGVTVRPVRRLRAWTATVDTVWGALAFRRASAVPAAVQVSSGDASPDRLPIRSPEAPILAALQATATATTIAARRRRR